MFPFLLSALALFLNPSADATLPASEIRQSVQRSLPYIEERGDWWIQKKKCMSCHRVSTMVWSLREASRQGFSVSERVDEWTDWAVTESLSENDKGEIKAHKNREGVAQLIVALRGSKEHASDVQKLATLITSQQEENGSWKPCGQLPSQKRPKPETAAVSAMWITMAVSIQTSPTIADDILANARKYIATDTPRKSTEWFTSRLMLANTDGDENTREESVRQLKESQREDGGWGWLAEDDSDALGTGLALFALKESGVPANDAAIVRATRFLIETQKEDGSWDVRGTKANRKDKVQETATYWGTTWAVLGLLAVLPEMTTR